MYGHASTLGMYSNCHLKQEENWKIIPLKILFISSNQTHSAEPQIKKNCHLVLEKHPGCHQPIKVI